MRRSTFVAAALAAVLLPFAALAQSDWPNRPVTFIVPYPPGGLNDAVARVFADRMTSELGRQVLVDNKAGAATTVASNFVAKAAPDGYTIYGGGTSLVINPTLTGNVQYDPHKSFDYVSLMSFTPFILQVNAEFPAKNMAELIAHVKANPGKFNIASSGIGATNHLAAELFKTMAGVDIVQIGYKGAGPGLNDLIAGQIQVMFPTAGAAVPHVKSGRVKALAVTSPGRSPVAPQLPTVAESGLPGYESLAIYGVFAPAKTPRAIVDRLNKEIARILGAPDTRERFLAMGMETVGGTPEQLAARVKSEMQRMGKVIRAAGIK